MSFWEGRRTLVTGGAGFIGSHLVEMLVEDGARVRVVDNLERGRLSNLEAVLGDIEFVEGDLRDRDVCLRTTQAMECVINMAAKVTGIEYNRYHHGDMYASNVLINTNTLDAARLNDVVRYCVVSTACIYPHDAIIPTPESEGDRGTPEPTNEGYGWAKRMAEKQGQYYAAEYGMEIAIVRPFNAYGPRDYYDRATSHVIPALIAKVIDGDDPVVVWGSGDQSRVFVHAEDFARGIKLVTEKYPAADPVNVGHDQETTIKELLSKIIELTGKQPRVLYDTSLPEGYRRRAADTTKLRQVTGGFVPQISLEQGLVEMIEWYQSTHAAVRRGA
ncbi:MAG: NAD-dependent epimerase/dehydratase family protein [Armatimonadota bacterium]|nr:MAG: NAD-dependent epimerase/dehydratase family protein [Armatimonadota bacterium]